MSDLEEKLKEILLDRSMGLYASDGEGNLVPVNWHDSPLLPEYVGKIKQAFIDAGYSGPTDRVNMMNVCEGLGFMIGQEWYDRFEKELDKVPMHIETKRVDKWMVVRAAKKAAGIL